MNRRCTIFRRRSLQRVRNCPAHSFCALAYLAVAMVLLAGGLPVAALLCVAAAVFHRLNARRQWRMSSMQDPM